jgi:membrane protein implicated in regulation of membrane protease activity
MWGGHLGGVAKAGDGLNQTISNNEKRTSIMATYLLWAIAGFVLIIAELLTGTFYLLVLGIAALAAAGVAFGSGDFWLQTITACGVAIAGIFAVHRWWQNHPAETNQTNNLDQGQAVVVESWVNQAAGLARVKYRGTTWDAKVEPGTNISDVLYIQSQANGVLNVTSKP